MNAWQPCRKLSVYSSGEKKYVVCGGKDGSVLFFDTDERTKAVVPSDPGKEEPGDVEHMRLRHPQCMRPVTVAVVHPEGTYLVACTSKNTIAIWKRN